MSLGFTSLFEIFSYVTVFFPQAKMKSQSFLRGSCCCQMFVLIAAGAGVSDLSVVSAVIVVDDDAVVVYWLQ